MARKIVIVSGIQLSTNPRVVKEADLLSTHGYDVVVLGATLKADLAARDRALANGKRWKYEALLDAESRNLSDRARWFVARLRLRAWMEFRRRLGVSGFRQLGYAGPEMLSYCLSHPADLYIVHNPQSMWVGRELLSHGARVAADVEDWYSEDLPAGDVASVPVDLLRECERDVLTGAAYVSTTSGALSHGLSVAYGCTEPVVVYNAFPRAERDAIDGKLLDRRNTAMPSLVWFSQVIAAGRGLEVLVDSLHAVKTPFEMHFRGKFDAGYAAALVLRAPVEWRHRIYFHEQVPHSELLSRISEHDIGYAGEVGQTKNSDLTIANKVFQYLLAGVPAIASDTQGHSEVALNAENAVFMFESGDSTSLATTLNDVLSDRSKLAAARDAAVRASDGVMSWDESAQRLLHAVQGAIGP